MRSLRSPILLRAGLVNKVERSFARTAEAAEPRRRDHFTNPLFTSLRSQAQTNLLRAGARRTKQGRKRVIDPSDWIQVLGQPVFGEGLDDHPGTVFGQRLTNML